MVYICRAPPWYAVCVPEVLRYGVRLDGRRAALSGEPQVPTGGRADGMRVSHLIAQVSGAEHLALCVICDQGHGVAVAASLRPP